MKQVIEGKRYDTETATKIGEGGGKAYPGDFHYYSEALYVTKKGSYFLAGEGGPLSRYGRPAYGGGTCGGAGEQQGEEDSTVHAGKPSLRRMNGGTRSRSNGRDTPRALTRAPSARICRRSVAAPRGVGVHSRSDED